MESKFKLPTETVELPSKGLLYPEGSALASGVLEMKYMTAKEEDILTNRNYIANGTVIDRLLKSLIVTENVNFNEILVGDKNAIMVAARILSYGKDYDVRLGDGNKHTIDLSVFESKPINPVIEENKKNEFKFTLPHSKNEITFKLLNQQDEISIERELAGLRKIDKESSPEVTTRLKAMILSVNGIRESKDIREFVDNYLLARDARSLREEYTKIQPDIDLTLNIEGVEEGTSLPIGVDFFWPDAGV